ncbi:phospholipase A and acyltransferase 1-like [Varanus komodoensis]|uniref:phospholipase A and acyltransferase 1-like n=1 Tax=Varanus komodoensis TaxID=61221 RepID=UPI001CF77AD2|nr:phospholipase A and acyltransferase 1-like [Varanus komodoensis]XP_044279220.1 phospholipase A and acyltransferase 1-like [Varanus komodoensis]
MNYIMQIVDAVEGIKDDVCHVFQNKDDPKPGDMIQFQMPGFQHWGIYVGNGDVVHFTSSAVTLKSVKFKVRKEKVKDVQSVLTFAVYNKFDKDYPPLPADQVVRRAMHMVDKVMKYDPRTANCEHFATLMRYNVAISGQAERFMFNVDKDFVKEVQGWLREIGE